MRRAMAVLSSRYIFTTDYHSMDALGMSWTRSDLLGSNMYVVTRSDYAAWCIQGSRPLRSYRPNPIISAVEKRHGRKGSLHHPHTPRRH